MKLDFLLQSGKKHTEPVLKEKTFSLLAGGVWHPLLQRCPGPAARSLGQSLGQSWHWHSFTPVRALFLSCKDAATACLVLVEGSRMSKVLEKM